MHFAKRLRISAIVLLQTYRPEIACIDREKTATIIDVAKMGLIAQLLY